MAQSKLELAVGTGKWDAGLKKAQQALNSFTQAQGGLQQALDKDNGKMQSFVHMMGKMDSTASTAKGQMNDYKRVLEQLTADYNKMSEAQRKSIGTDYLQTIDALKQKFQAAKQQVDEFNRSLGNTSEIKLPEGGSGLFGGGKLDGMLQVFGGNLMTNAAGFAASFASEIGSCVQQGIELARQGEGVRIAFERLGRGDILDGLREATHGTVTDIELMKAAVKFNDFKLPLDELGTMLAFAQQKAKDTGQSVDYMVDSIVTGLGRKSLMILDNLGLSATEIRERMKETGDMTKAVGAIIRDQMKNAGDYVETAADRAAQANVSLQNKMEELGRKFAPLEEASNQLWTSMKIGILDVIGGPLTDLLNKLTEAGRLKNMLNNVNGETGSGNSDVDKRLGKLKVAKAAGSDYMTRNLYNSTLEEYNRKIMAADKLIKQAEHDGKVPRNASMVLGQTIGNINDLRAYMGAYQTMVADFKRGAKDIMKPVETNIKTDKSEQNVKTLTAQLKELEKQRRDAVNKGDQEQVEALTKQISQTKTNLGYLDPNAAKSGNGGSKTDIQFANDSIMAQEKLVSDLTQKWKTASGELRGGYLKDLEEAQKKLDEMTGKAKGPDLDKLFPDMSKQNYNTGYQGSAQAKYDSARVDLAVGPMNFDAINDYIGSIKGMLKDANLGDELYTSLTEKLNDASTMTAVLQQAMDSGVQGVDLTSAADEMKRKLLEGDINEDAWQEFIDKLNEKIEDEDLKLVFDVDSKSIETVAKQQQKEAQNTAKAWNAAASAVSSVGDAMQKIEDPGIKAIGTVIQSIASIALGFAQASVQASSLGPWGWLAFLGAGAAAMATTISTVHSLTGFANGGIYDGPSGFVPGNKYSGDNVLANGGTVGLNSGELILNRAQQGVIAQELDGGSFDNLQLETRIDGRDLLIVMNNDGTVRGHGTLVRTKTNRS